MYGITEPLELMRFLVGNHKNRYVEAGVYHDRETHDYLLYGQYQIPMGLMGERLYRWKDNDWKRVRFIIHHDITHTIIQKPELIRGLEPLLIQKETE